MINIDEKQLEVNFNLHSMQPGFLNLELHYIIAKSESTFQFATWDEEPKDDEQKYYCFLTGNELYIAAGDITLKESYALSTGPAYPLLSNYTDFIILINTVLRDHTLAKGIRRFYDDQIDEIQNNLCVQFGDCEKHIVTSAEASHTLFVIKEVEVSISATMVYFRYKAPFSEKHYRDIQEQDRL